MSEIPGANGIVLIIAHIVDRTMAHMVPLCLDSKPVLVCQSSVGADRWENEDVAWSWKIPIGRAGFHRQNIKEIVRSSGGCITMSTDLMTSFARLELA